MPLTLLVADLLPPADAPAPMRAARLGSLEKWLARADIERLPMKGAWAWLGAQYGLAYPVPHAAIALAGEGGPLEGTWMRADPVHLRIERDLVALHDASVLDVTEDEAAALVAALQQLFRSDGLAFAVPAPDRWYLRVPDGTAPATTPLADAVGRDIFGLLPHGGPLNWRAAITEAQMVLSGHEVNASREARGLPAINSVWFWGEGALPPQIPAPFAEVRATDPFALGLAKLGGIEAQAIPEHLEQLAAVDPKRETLVVLDAMTTPFRRGDGAEWLAAARSLDSHWFEGLGNAASRFGGVRVVLPAHNDTVVASLKPSARWRLLRPRKPLAFHA